jgi:peptide/nickel transport system substrate-binding protein
MLRGISLQVALAAIAALGALSGPALAQKQGGILKVYHRDNPPSASVHEEATVSTNLPFMALYNNLVVYDQNQRVNSAETIVPDLAESWAWDDSKTKLTFKLRQGVKWHDGKPFTAKDVECTWNKLLGKDADTFRKNPRSIWYQNVKEIAVNGDHEATFVLNRPQPALLAMLASGYSPVYPCHVSTRDMRTKPIGTGPFKFVEFKQNEVIRLARNPDYFVKGKPYLDGIEMRIIANRSTRILGFVAGEFDMTFSQDITIPLLKDITSQAPKAVCEIKPQYVPRNLMVNREKPPFDDPKLREALALAIDRKPFVDILTEGKGDIGGVMLPLPEGQWGMPPEVLKTMAGYGGDIEKNRAEARKIMESKGYSASNPLKVKVSTRDIAIYRDPGVILIDQLKQIYVDGELEVVDTTIWHAKAARKDYTIGMNLTGMSVDDPDPVFYENYACKSERNYTQYCDPAVDKMIDEQSQETDKEKRKKLVWAIEKKLNDDLARPIIYHDRAATCWHPHVKGFVGHENSIYNNWRFSDVWLDK